MIIIQKNRMMMMIFVHKNEINERREYFFLNTSRAVCVVKATTSCVPIQILLGVWVVLCAHNNHLLL